MTEKNPVSSLIESLGSQGFGATADKVWRKISGQRRRVPAKLSMVVVEVTTHCHLECPGCARTVSTHEGGWVNKHIAAADFRKIVDALPPAKLFIPQGIGEPTMHPDLVELIGIAKSSKKFDRIEFNSTGLVRPPSFYGELFAAGLDGLTISVDTLDEDLVADLRTKTDLPKLLRRLGEFSTLFPGKIGVRVAVGKKNRPRLRELFKTLDGLGKYTVWLQPFFDMGDPTWVLARSEAEDLMAELPRWAPDYPNLKIIPEPFVPSAEICPSPWTSPAVTVDGELKPCCMVLHPQKFSLGNVLKVPFKELWSSDELERFRDGFVGRSPEVCSRCPYYAVRS